MNQTSSHNLKFVAKIAYEFVPKVSNAMYFSFFEIYFVIFLVICAMKNIVRNKVPSNGKGRGVGPERYLSKKEQRGVLDYNLSIRWDITFKEWMNEYNVY